MKLARFVFVAFLVPSLLAQNKPAGILTREDLRPLVPANYFYRGQAASVQMRNSAGVRTKDQKYVLAAMVDTSGYASNVAQKYQGFFITEVKVEIEGTAIKPGQYGFGFAGDKFILSDVGANDLLTVSSKKDDALERPVPLKIVEEGGAYRLYAGRKYVSFKLE